MKSKLDDIIIHRMNRLMKYDFIWIYSYKTIYYICQRKYTNYCWNVIKTFNRYKKIHLFECMYDRLHFLKYAELKKKIWFTKWQKTEKKHEIAFNHVNWESGLKVLNKSRLSLNLF